MVSNLLIYTSGGEAAFYRLVESVIPTIEGEYGRPKVLEDGCIEYQKGTPPDVPGYVRIGTRKFKPVWPSCRWRALSVTAPDGVLVIEALCHCPLAERHLQSVTLSQCASCTPRRPI
jgi:hypothetical protein